MATYYVDMTRDTAGLIVELAQAFTGSLVPDLQATINVFMVRLELLLGCFVDSANHALEDLIVEPEGQMIDFIRETWTSDQFFGFLRGGKSIVSV